MKPFNILCHFMYSCGDINRISDSLEVNREKEEYKQHAVSRVMMENKTKDETVCQIYNFSSFSF